MRVPLLVRYRWRGNHRAEANHRDGCPWCDSVTDDGPCTCRVRCVSGSCRASS